MKARTAQVRFTDAVEELGSQNKLAKFFGISPVNVSKWKAGGKEYLPDYRALQLVLECPELDQRQQQSIVDMP